ncbi:MAG: hypothetical protein RJA67_1205 [Bacteroidota bacterium]|jgi:hypothetical protein
MNADSSIKKLQDHRFENLVTKEYLDQKLSEILVKMNHLELRSIERMYTLEIRLLEKFNKLEIQLIEAKLEIFQWMCFFWITQMAVNVVAIMILLKK